MVVNYDFHLQQNLPSSACFMLMAIICKASLLSRYTFLFHVFSASHEVAKNIIVQSYLENTMVQVKDTW